MTWTQPRSAPTLPSLSSTQQHAHTPTSSQPLSKYDYAPVPASLRPLIPPIVTVAPPLPRTTSNSSATPSSAYSSPSTTTSAIASTSASTTYYPYPSSLMPPPPLPRKRKLDRERSHSPAPESSASPSSHGGDSEYDPTRTGAGSSARATRPKRIQSKPPPPPASNPMSPTDNNNNNNDDSPAMRTGPNGRPMSREQLRKANHSLIERRRREKINAALSDLRSMVPGLGDEGGKGGEFKLEVLERTVLHMRELKQHVTDLEDRIGRMQRVSESEEMDIDDEPSLSSSNSYRRSSHPSVSRSHSRHSATSHHSHHRANSFSHSHAGYHHSHSPVHAHHHSLAHSHSHSPRHASSQSTPPSPSMTPPLHMSVPMSPDPNETEAEADLPPALTLAHRATSGSDNTDSSGHTISPNPHPPSIASLLASSTQSRNNNNIHNMPLGTRVPGHPSPNIYLPFPTPSPTSPFLTYHGSAASTASSVTGPPEPSPFMAPLQNMSLFGGALDTPSTFDSDRDRSDRKQPSPPDLTMPPPGHPHPRAGDLGAEEAANLLLAFSSPETLRPSKTGSTPLMSALAMPPGQRRNNLDSEDFSLDGGSGIAKSSTSNNRSYHNHSHNHHLSAGYKPPRQGKTARDILRM